MIPVLQTLMAKGAKLDIENVYHKTAFDFQLFRKAIATYIPESSEKLTHVQKLNDDYADQIVKLKAKITDAKEKMSLLVKNYVEEREQAKKLTGANETLQGELTKVKEELAETKNRVAELERVNECLRGILQLREMTKSRSQMKLTLEVSSDDEGLDDDFSVMSPISTENSGSDENPCTIRDYQNLLRQFYDVTVSEYTTPLFQEMSKLPRLSSYNPRLSFGTQGELQILAFTSQGTKHIKEVSESFHSREGLRKKLQDLLAVMNNSEGSTHIPKISEQYSTLTNVRSELEAKLKKKRDKLQADWDSIQAKAAKFGSIYVKAKAKLERQQRAFLNAMDENNKRYDAIRSELQKRIDALDSQLLDFDTVFVEISDRFERQLDICLTRLQQQQVSLAQEMLTADSPVSKKEVLVKIQAVSSGLNAVFEALNKVQSMKTEFMEKVKPAVRHSPEPVALGKCSSSGGSDVDLSKIEWVLV
ncbi:hypothetical protein BKA69DRAFT_123228 [Paraphysoderma sedebokerense]|nr:hypothetical protein BKA69DRAFT_123228 [Paraphysoderma sedebokerense]